MSIDKAVSYYDAGGLETIDIIRAKLTDIEFKGFLLGNALKYLCRYNYKGSPKSDAEKAAVYTKLLAELPETVADVLTQRKKEKGFETQQKTE